jgi:hypothetical protein
MTMHDRIVVRTTYQKGGIKRVLLFGLPVSLGLGAFLSRTILDLFTFETSKEWLFYLLTVLLAIAIFGLIRRYMIWPSSYLTDKEKKKVMITNDDSISFSLFGISMSIAYGIFLFLAFIPGLIYLRDHVWQSAMWLGWLIFPLCYLAGNFIVRYYVKSKRGNSS